MANKKISAFANASALGGTEQLAGVQGGANVNVTPNQLNTFATGRLINVRIFTSGTGATYTPTAGTTSIIFELVGGGGGGGAVVQPTSTNVAVGQSGSGGAYLRKRLTSNFSGSTYTVGPKGTGGAAGNHAGGGGTNTTFIDTQGSPVTYTAAGGAGGAAGAAVAAPIGVQGLAGGAATNGDINMAGGVSGAGYAPSLDTITWSGKGGDSFYGSGGLAAQTFAVAASVAGSNGSGKGAGGSGAAATTTGAAAAGGDGTDGVIIIWEYS